MRRSEERLGYWLSRTPSPPGRDLEPGLRKRLLALLRGVEPRPAVDELPLEIGTSTMDLESDLTRDAHVQDGLGMLAPAAGIKDEINPCSSIITGIDLVDSTAVHAPVFSDTHHTRVLGWRLLPTPHIQFFMIQLKPSIVRTVGNLKTVPVIDGNRLLVAAPSIKNQIFPIAALPHRRVSITMDALQDAERREFLQQAQLLKYMRPENGELIAVFRHVPIEMITSLRYVTDERAIVYSISAEPKRSRTRVYDMAAVRDNATGDVHLVPRWTHVNLELKVTD